MQVLVNGVRLFFDVDGASLVPDGRTMREKPALVHLHGGPGFDHSIYKPRFSALSDIAQVVFLDQRGNGRSDPGPREAWTLAQWGGVAPVRWTVNCFRDRHRTLSEGGTEIAPPVSIVDPEGTVRSLVSRDRS